jgi:hypothetical protein
LAFKETGPLVVILCKVSWCNQQRVLWLYWVWKQRGIIGTSWVFADIRRSAPSWLVQITCNGQYTPGTWLLWAIGNDIINSMELH